MSIIAGTAIESALGGYEIERSLRFNSADSAYLNRTPGTPTSNIAWTYSKWIKRGLISAGSNMYLIHAQNGGNTLSTEFFVATDNTIVFREYGPSAYTSYLQTTQVFRDSSAWYQIVLVYNAANATSGDRVRLYVNGTRVTAFSTATYPSSTSQATAWNTSGNVQKIGYSGTNTFDGYMTEINFIDGQALDPTSFGEYNSETGVWQPIAYTGTYGNNGFYLNFSDNSNNTAATLGKDYSGNGNNWTPNLFSVTAGAGNDSLVDTPTNYGTDTGAGGEVRGNYATWNPLKFYSTTVPTLNNGNLQAAWNNTSMFCGSTIACPNGAKTYSEFTLDTANTTRIGIKLSSNQGQYTGGWTYIADSGVIRNTSDTNVQTGLSTSGNGTVIGIAVDLVANTLQFYRNGSTLGTSISIANADDWLFWVGQNGSGSSIAVTANFGQRPFAYTAPSGFKALCTTNLPGPTVKDGSQYMDALLWTGDGSQTRSLTGLAFQPDFTWMKSRSVVQEHQLYDVVRGAGGGKMLCSNLTAQEGQDGSGNSDSQYGYLSSFDSGGFSVDDGSVATTGGWVNYSGRTYVAWNWKANGSGVSNTAGTITSTVSANTTTGFSIATYTGTGGSGTTTVGHGLSGVAPAMVIVKRRNSTSAWPVYHKSLTSTSYYVELNTTAAQQTYGSTFISPGSTTLTIAADSSLLNASGGTYVAYCFSPVDSYSAFGSYQGNSSSDGPFIYLGFRPRYVMWKISSGSTGDWYIVDSVRDTYNVASKTLWPDLNYAEGSGANLIDFVSNGFKIRNSGGSNNGSGYTFIYAAFAESPFKYSLGR